MVSPIHARAVIWGEWGVESYAWRSKHVVWPGLPAVGQSDAHADGVSRFRQHMEQVLELNTGADCKAELHAKAGQAPDRE